MDLLYGFLKIASLIGAGIFGALGLLTKYKDEAGKITRWGRIALGGIVISSTISLGLYILETYRAKAKAVEDQTKAAAMAQKLETILINAQTTAEQQKKSLDETNALKRGLDTSLTRSDEIARGMNHSLEIQESVLSGNQQIFGGVSSTLEKQGELLKVNTNTLNEVSRGLYPIKDVRIGYWIRVPTNHPQLKPYLDRFNSVLAPMLPLPFDSRMHWLTGGTGSGENPKYYDDFGFSAAAPFAPDRDKEKLAYMLLNYLSLDLHFYRTPIATANHRSISGNGGPENKPDLELGVSSELSSEREKHSVVYDLKSKQFMIRGSMLRSDPQYWQSTDRIVGLPDLLGGQMFVHLRQIMVSGDPTVDQYLTEIRKGLEIQTLIVSLSSGREFWFKGDELQKHVDQSGHPIYSFIFPKTAEELRKLER